MNNKSLSAWDRVMLARSIERPTSIFYITEIFEDFIELHGDRSFGDDASIIGGIGLLDGNPVTVIAEEKGRTVEEKTKRNFGSPHPEGYRKALRLMKQAEKFNRPIICFVDTQGAFCGIGAEERGQGEAIARNLREMMNLTVPIIAIVLGEGGSGGALAIAVANKVIMLENAVYSILSPEGFAAILWKDSTRAQEAAQAMRMTAEDLLHLNIIEEIIPEPDGGAHLDKNSMAEAVRSSIINTLSLYTNKAPEEIASERYNRFRSF